MPRYKYKSVSASGTVIEGEMEAADRQAVIDGLHRQGGTPIRADLLTDHARFRFWPRTLAGKHGAGPKQVGLITRELATLLKAGLPIDCVGRAGVIRPRDLRVTPPLPFGCPAQNIVVSRGSCHYG